MAEVGKTGRVEGHSWDRVPPKLPPEKQTRMTFLAKGAMLPRQESKATLSKNSYSELPESLSEEADEATELAQSRFPNIPPKFLGKK